MTTNNEQQLWCKSKQHRIALLIACLNPHQQRTTAVIQIQATIGGRAATSIDHKQRTTAMMQIEATNDGRAATSINHRCTPIQTRKLLEVVREHFKTIQQTAATYIIRERCWLRVSITSNNEQQLWCKSKQQMTVEAVTSINHQQRTTAMIQIQATNDGRAATSINHRWALFESTTTNSNNLQSSRALLLACLFFTNP